MSRAFASASSQYLEYAGAIVNDYPYTLSCWFYPTDLTANRALLGVYDNTVLNKFFYMGVNSTSKVFHAAQNTVLRSSPTTTTCSLNTWNHACAVGASATSRSVYLNGGGKATNTNNVALAIGNRTAIGRRSLSTPDQYMDGRIGEVAVWSAALSDAEVAALGAGASPLQVRRGSLVAYWPLFGLASPEPEYVGSGKGMTVTGATLADHAPVRSPFALPGPWGWQGAFKAAGGPQQYPQSVGGTLTSSGLLVKQEQKIFAGGWSGSGLLVKQTGKPLAGALTSSGDILRTFGRSTAGTLTDSGGLSKQTGKPLAGSLSDSGLLVKQTAKGLVGDLTSSGAFNAFKVALVSLAGSLSSSGLLVKQAAKPLTGALTDAGTLIKEARKGLAGSLSSSGAFAGTKVALVALAGTFSAAGGLVKRTALSLAGSLSSSGVPTKAISISTAGMLASAGAIQKQAGKIVSGLLSSLGDLLTQWIHVAVVEKKPLTLYARSEALTLETRGLALSLATRPFAFTLETS